MTPKKKFKKGRRKTAPKFKKANIQFPKQGSTRPNLTGLKFIKAVTKTPNKVQQGRHKAVTKLKKGRH